MSALPHPPVPVGRGPLAALKSPAEPEPEQETRASSREQEPGTSQRDMGRGRTEQRASTSPVQPRDLIAVHDLPPAQPASRPSVILIAVHDSPAGRCSRPPGRPAAGRCRWPQAMPSPEGRCSSAARPCPCAGPRSGFRRGAVEYAKNIFAYLKHHFCTTCRKHFSRIFSALFPHAPAG